MFAPGKWQFLKNWNTKKILFCLLLQLFNQLGAFDQLGEAPAMLSPLTAPKWPKLGLSKLFSGPAIYWLVTSLNIIASQ